MINLKKIESSENIAKEITDLETLVEEVNEKIDFYKDLEKDGGKAKKDGQEALSSFSG